MYHQKIFEIIPEHFFSVLSCSNADVYADCLFLMFHFLGKGNSFGGKKESIVELLTDYFNHDNDEQTSRQQAMGILRRLIKCGWIFEEEDANYEMIINFTYYAIPILKSLNDLKKNESLAYIGYIYLIYSALKNIEIDSLSDILDQVYYNTTIILNKLKSLNANIKKYMQDLLNKQDINDLKCIVNNLFVDYKQNVIDDQYQRLKTSDNISKYRPFIISKLNEISLNDTIINGVCSDLVNKKRFVDMIKAKSHVYEQIDYIISSFEKIDYIMSEIDKKNTMYIHTSISKILFIVNNTQDLSGKINKILRHYVKQKKIDDYTLYHLFPQKYLETKSLYTMPIIDKEMTLQTIEYERSLNFEEKKERLKKFIETNVFSKNKINEYVKYFLSKNQNILASTLPLNNYCDYTKLVLIYMYSGSHVDYEISKRKEIYQNNGYLFDDFEIRRK